MIYCQKCLHEQPEGTVFCDKCGTSLLTGAPHGGIDTPPTPLEHTPPIPLVQREGDLTPANPLPTLRAVPQRGKATMAQPRIVPQRYAQPAPMPAPEVSTKSDVSKRVRLRLTNGKTFELSGKAEYLIGRRDPELKIVPDVDLADWNGAASGVSREHAAIYVGPDGVFIEDRESLNETIRNSFRLLPRQLYPLKDGDELRLGSITMLVVIS